METLNLINALRDAISTRAQQSTRIYLADYLVRHPSVDIGTYQDPDVQQLARQCEQIAHTIEDQRDAEAAKAHYYKVLYDHTLLSLTNIVGALHDTPEMQDIIRQQIRLQIN